MGLLLEKMILATSAILFVWSIFIAPYFAERWLNASTLPPSVIRTAFVLMMLTAIARWLGAIYRGGVVGIDRQVALAGIVITFAVLRVVLVMPIIMIGPRIEFFFVWQLLAIVVEAAAMRTLLGRTFDIPFVSARFSWRVLSSRAKLSLSIALATMIWTCTAQIDKIAPAKMLPLADFAVFSLATLLASGILLLANPIQQAFIPRLTTGADGNVCSPLPRERSSCRTQKGICYCTGRAIWAFFHSLSARGPIWRHSSRCGRRCLCVGGNELSAHVRLGCDHTSKVYPRYQRQLVSRPRCAYRCAHPRRTVVEFRGSHKLFAYWSVLCSIRSVARYGRIDHRGLADYSTKGSPPGRAAGPQLRQQHGY
ncbi:MATE family efflux transporter [Paraburkholderia sp. RL17-373-BIF-A]|uniref:hypothetical protein n=1 Tax=Paraburkholderia sp. RL17-373-BIF-A TaxID=3031629 RepID=UPI0038B8B8EB